MGTENWKVKFVREVDLSPAAITERLRDLGQLYELAVSLGKAKVRDRVRTPSPSEDR